MKTEEIKSLINNSIDCLNRNPESEVDKVKHIQSIITDRFVTLYLETISGKIINRTTVSFDDIILQEEAIHTVHGKFLVNLIIIGIQHNRFLW